MSMGKFETIKPVKNSQGFFNGLILGIVMSAAGFWLVQIKSMQPSDAELRYEQAIFKARDAVTEAAKNEPNATAAILDMLDLHNDEIRSELAKKGELVRRKPLDIGDGGVGADSDARAVADIKAKYAAHPSLSGSNIVVNCAQGHVTLIGAVPAPENIGRAIAIALKSDGVRDVTSTLQLKAN